MKKSFLSALVFFATLMALTMGYAAWNSPFTMSSVGSGSGLTANSWNALVNNINDLDSRFTNRPCPSGMIKIADYCIDNASVSDAAGEDQKMAMQRCAGQNKHLCSFGEYKTAWIINTSLVCPSGVGRYSTSEIFAEGSREMTVFDCQNCPTASNGCIGAEAMSTDSADKSMCCLNP